MPPMPLDGAILRRQVDFLARAYLSQARELTFAQLCERQDPPWGGVALGAGGLVYTLGRSRRRGQARAADLAHAASVLSAARKRAGDPGVLRLGEAGERDVSHSVFCGPAGQDLLGIHLAIARREPRKIATHLRSFLDQAHAALGGPTEFYLGAAGFLNTLLLLHRKLGDPRALAAADTLAGDLLERANRPESWSRAEALTFAHGRAGVFYALLAWSLAADRSLPGWFFDELAALGADLDRQGNMGAAPDSEMEGSWCNGATGLALLWARAYERTGQKALLDRARRTGRFLVARTKAHEEGSGDLCCGLGGRAYALLALDRIDARGGWSARAFTMAAAAADRMLEAAGPWPNGLFQGFPGFVCLARDILGPPEKRVGFPLVEG